MGKLGWIFCLSILLTACAARKKTINDRQLISKTDSAIVISNFDTTTVDSVLFKRQFFNKVIGHKIEFQTFNGKIKVAYKTKDADEDVTVYVKIAKDSVIWLSVRGLFGIEGARILISKDSVKVINYLEKTVLYKDINYLEQLTGLPFDFSTILDFIIGNPVFIDSNVASYSMKSTEQMEIIMAGYIFKHVASVDAIDYKIIESEIKENADYLPRNCHISYSNYDKTQGFPFSINRLITVTGQNNLEMKMEYKSYSFNDAVSFPFSIPDNYKKL